MTVSFADAPEPSSLFGFFTKSLSRSMSVLFGAITLITVSCAAYDYFLVEQEKAAATAKQDEDEKNADLLMKMIWSQQQIRFDIVQVQQFLQDYSSTRGQDGLDSGLAEAAKYADRLPKDIAAAKKAAEALRSPDFVTALSKVERTFPEYYGKGLEMAKVYADQGPSAGNKLMVPFDELSEAMQKDLEETSAALDAIRERQAAAAAASKTQINELRDRLALIALANVAITAPRPLG